MKTIEKSFSQNTKISTTTIQIINTQSMNEHNQHHSTRFTTYKHEFIHHPTTTTP